MVIPVGGQTHPQQHAQGGLLSFLLMPWGHERAEMFLRDPCQQGPRHHAALWSLFKNFKVCNKLPAKL